MRIPLDSCPPCNQGAKLLPSGYHYMVRDGRYIRCAFVAAELADLSDVELVSVRTSRRAAVRDAKKSGGALLWCGQAPRDIWLVVRLKSRRSL